MLFGNDGKPDFGLRIPSWGMYREEFFGAHRIQANSPQGLVVYPPGLLRALQNVTNPL